MDLVALTAGPAALWCCVCFLWHEPICYLIVLLKFHVSCLVSPQQCQGRALSTCSCWCTFTVPADSLQIQQICTHLTHLTHPLHCRLLWPLLQRANLTLCSCNGTCRCCCRPGWHAGAWLLDPRCHWVSEVQNIRLDPAPCHSACESYRRECTDNTVLVLCL